MQDQSNVSGNTERNQRSGNFQAPRTSEAERDVETNLDSEMENEEVDVAGTDEDIEVEANPSRYDGAQVNNTKFNQSVTGTGNQNSRSDNRSDSLSAQKAESKNGQAAPQRAGLNSQGAERNSGIASNDQNQIKH